MLADLTMRVAASSHFRWMPGMLVTDGVSVAYRIYHDGYVLRWIPNVPGWPAQDVMSLDAFREQSDMYLVLEDAATKGCLEELVREAWDRPMLAAYYAPLLWKKGWYVAGARNYPVVPVPADSELQALADALEAAPQC